MKIIIILTLFLSFAFSTFEEYKEDGRIGVSWSGENMIGATGVFKFDEKIGVVATFKTSFESLFREDGDDFYDYSYQWAENLGDPLRETDIAYTSLAVGLAYIWDKFTLYGAVGHTDETEYRRYYDYLHILGDDGHYWINGEEHGGGAYFNFGFMFSVPNGKYDTQLYIETDSYPKQISIGASFGMP